ncbi:hypothetical protein PMAYCL1PPCAC_03269, partial [Pristionchus mayeri]
AHTSSLSLALLRHSTLPSQSFVFSPLSLNIALAIDHDGASGTTQHELTNLLLGKYPSEVAAFYSSIIASLHTTEGAGATCNSANRFYVDNTIQLKSDYQKHVEDKYNIAVQNIDLSYKAAAVCEINKYVEEATHGRIKQIASEGNVDGQAIIISVIHFLGKWKRPFRESNTEDGPFKGYNGRRKISFMSQTCYFPLNQSNDIGTFLAMPYQDEQFNFFCFMPDKSSNLDNLRTEL